MGWDWLEHKPTPGKVSPPKSHRGSETGCWKDTAKFVLIVVALIVAIACGRPEDSECKEPGSTKVVPHHVYTCGEDYHWHPSKGG